MSSAFFYIIRSCITIGGKGDALFIEQFFVAIELGGL